MTTSSRQTAASLLAFALPLLAGALLTRLAPEPQPPRVQMTLENIAVEDAAELDAVFAGLGYEWPLASPPGRVPAVAVRAMPADITALSVAERKQLFFRILAPLVAAENRKLREQRTFLAGAFNKLQQLPENGPLAERVREIASRFNVSGDLDDPNVRRLLLRRVDIVPGALVMAQAANESGWGTSRFAREANNLFGMWTWDENKGLAPRDRAEDAAHFVRVFDNLQQAVANYLHTINVGPAYGELRELRALQRARGEYPDAMSLAAGLVRYSARGEAYVAEIREIIEYNHLQELPPLALRKAQANSEGSLPADQ